jgi:flagellar biosynthesis protein FlhG
MDLGAGTARHTMDFFTTAHLGVLTALPEPTSIENAYVFLKTHLWNLVDHVAVRSNMESAIGDIRAVLRNVGKSDAIKGYTDAFRQLSSAYPEFVNNLLKALSGRDVGIVINQTRSQADIDIGPAMEMICKRYFGVQASFLGDLNYDDSAWKSLRNRRLLLNDFPHAILSKRLAGVSAAILQSLGHQE